MNKHISKISKQISKCVVDELTLQQLQLCILTGNGRRRNALYFNSRNWKHLSRLSRKIKEVKGVQNNVNGFVFCEEE